MHFFKRVTILGIALLVFLLSMGCGSGWHGKGKKDRNHAGPGSEALGAHLQQAILQYHQGDLTGAGEILDEVLVQDPENPLAAEYQGYLDRIVYCTVYPGDTLSGIADYYYGDMNLWPVLMRANGIGDPKQVKAYERLRVPWFSVCGPEKDELGRLRKSRFRGKKLTKIVVQPAREGESLETLARRYYGDTRYGFFLADYNVLEVRSGVPEKGTPLKIPVLKGKARKRKTAAKRPEQTCLDRAEAAMKNRDYEKACECLAAIPRKSPSWSRGEPLLARCLSEGVSHYEGLGDGALQASDPESACRYWQSALALDPENSRVKTKLEEARDLMQTLNTLPEIE